MYANNGEFLEKENGRDEKFSYEMRYGRNLFVEVASVDR